MLIFHSGANGNLAHFLLRAAVSITTALLGSGPALFAFVSIELVGVVGDEATLAASQLWVDTAFTFLHLQRTIVEIMDVAQNNRKVA